MVEKLVPNIRFRGFDDEWKDTSLSDIATFSKGKGISKNDIYDEGIECVRYGELYTKYGEIIYDIYSKTNLDKTELVLSDNNDILIPCSGETAIDLATASCIQKDQVAIGGDITIIKTNQYAPFITYYLNQKKNEIARFAQGVSIVHLYPKDFKSLKLKIPSINEQKKIIFLLEEVTKKETLLEKKYHHYQDFKKYLIQQIFTQKLRFKDDEIWKTVKLGDICNITMGQSPSSENYTENNSHTILIQGNADIIDGKIVPRVYTSEITKISKPGDIIMTVRAPVGDLAINEFESCIGRGVCSIEGNKFIYYLLQSLKDKHVWERLSQGSTFESINSNDIKNLKTSIPSKETQETIYLFLTEIDNKIDFFKIQYLMFQKFKKGLLQQMFV